MSGISIRQKGRPSGSHVASSTSNESDDARLVDLTERDADSGFGLLGVGRPEVVVQRALDVLERRMRVAGQPLTSPQAVRDYLRLRLADLEHEVFLVLFLDTQHRLIGAEEMFRGTLSQTSVYPREVVKAALRHNAAAVVFAHNHPSGIAEPSRADEMLTQSLKAALALVDVRTLDHFVVGGRNTISFAERGLL